MQKKLRKKNIDTFYQLLLSFKNYHKFDALWTSDQKIKLSYEDFFDEVMSFSVFLSTQIDEGQRVILIDLHGPHWVVAFFAVILNKGIVVPIDSRMTQDMQKEVVEMVSPALLITCQESFKSKVKKIVFEENKKMEDINWKVSKIKPETPAEIIFTSGTWGKPKGVVLTHKNLLSNLNAILKIYQPTKKERLLSVLPLSHAYEQMCGLLVPLASGCHIVYQTSLDSYSLINSLSNFKVHYMVVVPKFLELLKTSILRNVTGSRKPVFYGMLNLARFLRLSDRRILFKSLHKKFGGDLHTFIVGGAPFTATLENFFKIIGFNCMVGYGLSESSPVLSVSQTKDRPANCVGLPLPGIKIEIDSDDEIIAEGDNISPGYWPMQKYAVKRKLKTGDLGFLDEDGRLFVTGRKKNMVVYPTGDKIQLEDIENEVMKLKGVSDVCIVSVDENDPKLILVYVGEVKKQEITEYINNVLPLYARISRVIKWKDKTLPSTHTLKIRRDVILESI